MRRTFICWGTLFCVLLPAFSQSQKVRVNDNSDWWSILTDEDHAPGLKPGAKLLDESNFQILGVSVGEGELQEARAKLGNAREVERGDAATGRHQICYKSAASGENTYLIFELGEVAENFYVFSGKKTWSGRDLCLQSNLVSRQIATASGVRLGMGRGNIEKILGTPDRVEADQVFYWRQGDVGTYLEAHFLNDRLEYLAVSKVETD
jgi:hypothetical protein